MCLAVPMKIKHIDRLIARCEAKGVEREASLFMVQDEIFTVGDYVVIDRGYVTQKLTEDEALAAWTVYDEMLGENVNQRPSSKRLPCSE